MAATSSLRFLLPVSRASDHHLILSLVDRKICSSFLVLVLDLVEEEKERFVPMYYQRFKDCIILSSIKKETNPSFFSCFLKNSTLLASVCATESIACFFQSTNSDSQ
jgi:hypothetical protein